MTKRLIAVLWMVFATAAQADTVLRQAQFTGKTPGGMFRHSDLGRSASGEFGSVISSDGSEGLFASWFTSVEDPVAGTLTSCRAEGLFPFSAVTVTGTRMNVHFEATPTCGTCLTSTPFTCVPSAPPASFAWTGEFTLMRRDELWSTVTRLNGNMTTTSTEYCIGDDGVRVVCTWVFGWIGQLTSSTARFSGTVGPVGVQPPEVGYNADWWVQKGQDLMPSTRP
jgi:hypothetical protein